MDSRSRFDVPKKTGTYADTLMAVGLAAILEELSPEGTVVSIGDEGPSFSIQLSKSLGDELSGEKLTVGYQYLAHEKAQSYPLGISPEPFDYVQQRIIEATRQKWRESQSKRKRKRAVSGEDVANSEPPRADSRLMLYKALNSLRAGSDSWNNLAHAVQSQIGSDSSQLAKYAVSRASGFSNTTPSLLAKSLQAAKASVLQVFWPTVGKGTNRSKPDGAKLDNLKGDWIDWFNEWCRYRGVAHLATARFVGTGGGDLKFVCMLPGREITFRALGKLANELNGERMFVEGHAYTNVKSDVFAVLGLARWLVLHSDFAPRPEERTVRFLKTIRQTQPRVRDLLAGVQVAYFKKMGTGKALSNLATILLPDWFPVLPETYEVWRAILDEHRQVLATLREDRGDEASLLLNYREAVSRNEMDLYLEFFADYGMHYMRKKGRGDYSEQFTVQNLEVLVMALSESANPRISGLLHSAGFRSIANAIHEATVKAQYWKGQGKQEYEIHYGLAQKWKRSIDQGTDTFLQELADFVRAYNQENGKRQEKGRPSRDAVAQPDLDSLLSVITTGEVDARTVCLLLLAYGYSMTDDEKSRSDAARAAKRSGAQ